MIAEVSAAWDIIPAKLFGSHEEQAPFQHAAVREGLFRSIVLLRENGSAINTFFLKAGLNPAISSLKNYRPVLQQWISPFREQQTSRVIRHEIEETSETESFDKGRRKQRKSFNRAVLLENVQSQKALIIEMLHRRELERARKLTNELIAYQLKTGGPIYAVKSLCDLAIEAKTLGLYSLQLELTEQSVKIKDDDAWAWAQYADALLNAQQLDNALEAYEQAYAFGVGIVAKKGQAEVLKAKGQLDAALVIYEEVVAAYPEDVVARTGRAEVLKAKGQFDVALAAYEEAINIHPESVVAKTGRAETLKALGRFDEALAAYNLIVNEHPENVVARTGRAETLKALGRFDEALAAYEAVIADFPLDNVAKRARSCVLMALGRYEQALENLPEGNLVTFGDWVGYHIRGMILLRTGKIDEAIQIFQRGTDNPWPLHREYFNTALAIALIKRRNFMQAGQVLDKVAAPLLQPQANLLRLHSYGEQNNFERASEAYESLTTNPWSISDELISELHRRYILKEEPRYDDDWVIEQEESTTMLLIADQQAMLSSSFSAFSVQ